MNRARQLLWIVNGLLGVAIVIFSALAFPARTDYLRDIDPDAALPSPPPKPSEPPNEEVLLTLRNPLGGAGKAPPPARSTMSLHGALPTVKGQKGAAFIRTDQNTSLVVAIGEEVQGWRLEELWRDQAAFTNSRGERKVLQFGR